MKEHERFGKHRNQFGYREEREIFQLYDYIHLPLFNSGKHYDDGSIYLVNTKLLDDEFPNFHLSPLFKT